jgi:hypothetical protein
VHTDKVKFLFLVCSRLSVLGEGQLLTITSSRNSGEQTDGPQMLPTARRTLNCIAIKSQRCGATGDWKKDNLA